MSILKNTLWGGGVYNTKKVDTTTKIYYFVGAFSTFHKGHISVIERIQEKIKVNNEKAVIVISPANSDYVVSKYSKRHNISNKTRYDNIIKSLHEHKIDISDIILDLDPMLNCTKDYNFTDLLKAFIESYNIQYDDMAVTPSICLGKDDYTEYNKYQKRVILECYPDITGCSSRDEVKLTYEPKHCLLRCHNKQQLAIFRKYYDNVYLSITPSYIRDEQYKFEKIIDNLSEKNIVTICKDYTGGYESIIKGKTVHYLPVHRKRSHALASPTYDYDNELLCDLMFNGFVKTCIDSDIFTGGNKKFITQFFPEFIAIHDFSDKKDWEIVDIDDIINSVYRYPFECLSDRMSLPPFTHNDHIHFNNLVNELKELDK